MTDDHVRVTIDPASAKWPPNTTLPREQREALLEAALEFVRERGTVEVESYYPASPPGTLAMMARRTRYHLRLSAPDKEEFDTLVILAMAVFIATGGNTRAAALAGINNVRERISALSTRDGERSVAFAVASLGAATHAEVWQKLTGRACPYPERPAVI